MDTGTRPDNARRSPHRDDHGRRHRYVRRIAIAAVVSLVLLATAAALAVLVLLDQASCESEDPDAQAMLGTLEIVRLHPSGSTVLSAPQGPGCAALVAGPKYLPAELDWSFRFHDRAAAQRGVDQLVAAAQSQHWKLDETVPDQWTFTQSRARRSLHLDVSMTDPGEWDEDDVPPGSWDVHLTASSDSET